MEPTENVHTERGLTKMALTIDDIYDKEFALKGGGYDRNDVDQFLDEICDEMTNMLEHIEKLEKDLQQAHMEVEAAQNAAPVVVKSEPVAQTSATLEGILLSAQRLADEAVENAKTKAQGIVKEAEEKAEKIVDEARTEKETLSGQLVGLRKSVAEYKKGFQTLLEKYKTLLENEDFLGE